MIADSTLVTVHEVLKSLRELERSKLEDSPSETRIVLGEITGGFGSPGGDVRIDGKGGDGGDGGDGEGPKLDIHPDERWQVGNVSGGTGGNGGTGVDVGGKGGTGKGPMIGISPRRLGH